MKTMKLMATENISLNDLDGWKKDFTKGEVVSVNVGAETSTLYDAYLTTEYMSLLLPKDKFVEVGEKEEFLWKLRKQLEFTINNERLSDDRKLDQIYGFCQGCIFCHDDWFDEIAELNGEYRDKLLYGNN